MRFHFIVAVRNGALWIERCLESLLAQRTQYFTITVVDDASTDGTGALAETYLWDHARIAAVLVNSEHRGALFSQCSAIRYRQPDPDDVIVIVDGDDYLAHTNVLNRVDSAYESHVEVTYGNYRSEPLSSTCPTVRALPPAVTSTRTIRRFTRTDGIWFNHLRTFRYRTFEKIDQERNFRWPDGAWFQTCADTAVMIPLLELAGANYRFIDETLYVYNSENPTSDWRRAAPEIDRTHHYILSVLGPVA